MADFTNHTDSYFFFQHYRDVIRSPVASQITSHTIVYSTVYSGLDQRKLQSSMSLTFVRGIHRPPVNSPHKGSETRKIFLFDDVIMTTLRCFAHKSIQYCWLTRNKIRIRILAVLITLVGMKLSIRVCKIMSLNLFWTLQSANIVDDKLIVTQIMV